MVEPTTSYHILINKLKEIILENLGNENFGVRELTRESGISRTSLNRKLRKILNKSTNQFIREVRLKKALELLKNGSITASEVAYKVGFASPAYFNTCFHEFFGYPPGKVKREDSESSDESFGYQFSYIPGSKGTIRKIIATYKIFFLLVSVLIIIATFLVYPKIIKRKSLDDLRSSDGRISVAVMPFQNMTDNKIWDEIQINLISYLSNWRELKVRNEESIKSLLESKGLTSSASITPSVAGAISKRLDANVFIYGIIDKTGSVVRVNAQLVNSKTKEVFRSFQIEGPSENVEIFKIIDSLSVLVKNFLVKSKMEKEVNPDLKPYKYTNSPVAYQYFIEAHDALQRHDVATALSLYSSAVAADTNFIPAIIFLSMRYIELGKYENAKKWCLKAFEKREGANKSDRIMVDWYHAMLFETPNEEIKYLKQYQDADDQVPVSYWKMGYAYLTMFQYSKAIPEYEKALAIYKKWGIKPMMMDNYTSLMLAYHKTGQYKKEKRLFRKAEKDFPNDQSLLYKRQAILAFTEGDTVSAEGYIEKYRYSLEDLSMSEATIMTKVASLYSEASILDKAEEYYRKVLSLESGNPVMINNLAYFLIETDIDINEGLALVETALNSEPDNHNFLHTKGWGLYKQGNPREALKFLQRSWELKPVYDYSIFLHLEEAKKAVLVQK